LQDARKRHYPLCPDARLTPKNSARVRIVYRNRHGADILRPLGFAACVDQETKKALRLDYCNDTMA